MRGKKRLLPLCFIAVLAAITLSAVISDPAGAKSVLRQGWDHPTVLAVELEEIGRASCRERV